MLCSGVSRPWARRACSTLIAGLKLQADNQEEGITAPPPPQPYPPGTLGGGICGGCCAPQEAVFAPPALCSGKRTTNHAEQSVGLRDELLRPKQLSLILPKGGLTQAPQSGPHSKQPVRASIHTPSLGNYPRGAACTQCHRQARPHIKDSTHPASIPHACAVTAKARAWECCRKSE